MIGLPTLEVPERFTICGANPYGMVRVNLLDQVISEWAMHETDYDSSEYGGVSYFYVTLSDSDCLLLALCFEADHSVTFAPGSYPFAPEYRSVEWDGMPENFPYSSGEVVIVHGNDRGWYDISERSWLEDSEEFAELRATLSEECYGTDDEECQDEETEEDWSPLRTFADDLRECEDFYSDPNLFGTDGTIPTTTEES